MTAQSTEPDSAATVHLELEEGYRFSADFGGVMGTFELDEPAPLGAGSAPNPSRVLAAAVGGCLGSSLLFCLRRAHVEVETVSADVTVTPIRNPQGRLRIGSLQVTLHPRLAPGSENGFRRCLDLFEDYCVVTASVRDGIEVEVKVEDPK
jgi:uncharacterized OsmC-like protein